MHCLSLGCLTVQKKVLKGKRAYYGISLLRFFRNDHSTTLPGMPVVGLGGKGGRRVGEDFAGFRPRTARSLLFRQKDPKPWAPGRGCKYLQPVPSPQL